MDQEQIAGLEADLQSDNLQRVVEALLTITFTNPPIDVTLLFKLLEHPIREVAMSAFQALGTYNGQYTKEIIQEIKTCDAESFKHSMLLAVLAIDASTDNILYFIAHLSDPDEATQTIAATVLANYGQVAIVPLLHKVGTATEDELALIRLIFERIGKKKVLGILKGFPYLPLIDNLARVFSEEELKEIIHAK